MSERTNSLTVAALIEAARHIGTAPCIGTARVSERTDSLTVAALIEAAPHIGTAPPTGAARVSKRSAGVYGTVPQSGYSAAGTLPLPFRPSQRIEARHSMRLRLLTGDPLAPLA